MDTATAAYAALLDRLEALDPAYMTQVYRDARLRNWEYQCGDERGQKTLTDKVQAEVRVREVKKERER